MKLWYILGLLALAVPLGLWWALGPKQVENTQKVLAIGTTPQFPPFEYIKEGTIVGFNIDLMEAIAQEIGVCIEWHAMPFDFFNSGLANRHSSYDRRSA